MYIIRRTGGGRGVYEIAGTTGNLSASTVVDHELILTLTSDIFVELGLIVTKQGGKPRIEIKEKQNSKIMQIQRQVAALLLLPKPIRANDNMADSSYVLRRNSYVIEKIQMSEVYASQKRLLFFPETIEVKNLTRSILINGKARWNKIFEIWKHKHTLPNRLFELIDEHESAVGSKTPLKDDVEKIVFEVQKESQMYAVANKIDFDAQNDVLELLSTFINSEGTDEFAFVDEAETNSELLYEGSVKQIRVNAYERNSKARQICIDYYGFDCSICGMNFEKTYGILGSNFIHVHHIKPLKLISGKYLVDPIKDLRPVCPNCHAMLHRKDPPLTIEELKLHLSV